MLEVITLETLTKIDNGRLDEAFKQDLIEINRDMANRPFDDSVRSLTLKIKFKPATFDNKTKKLEQVGVEFEIKKSLPPRNTSPVVMNVNDNNEFLFNDLSLDEPNQHTLDEVVSVDEDEASPASLKINTAAS